MNKQQKIDKIYKVIADKTLSFGCKFSYYRDSYQWQEREDYIIISKNIDDILCYNNTRFYQSWKTISQWIELFDIKEFEEESLKIIWHPIYPHHILQRVGKEKWIVIINWNWKIEILSRQWLLEDKYKRIRLIIYRDLSKDLYWQSDETIDSLYSLIQQVKWTN